MKKYFVLLLFALVIIIVFTGCDSPWVFPTLNNDPLIISNPITSASVGINYTYQVGASDEDGDTLVYSISTNPTTNMVINSSTGLISWTPTNEGSYSITVKVSDGKSTDTQSFTIAVSEISASGRVVVMELFVGPKCSRCSAVEDDVIRLREEYGYDELIIVKEYGWDIDEYTGWGIIDVKKRYFDYLNYLGIDGGFPDGYFNGLSQTVHNSDGEGYTNYKNAIDNELKRPSKIAITASCNVVSNKVNISGTVTNFSTEDFSKIVIEAMIYEDSVYSSFMGVNVDQVVRDIITFNELGQLVDSLSSGESVDFSLTSANLSNVHDMNNIHVVVYVQAPNSPKKEILQAFYVE